MKHTLNILRGRSIRWTQGRLCLLLCLGLFAACSSDDDEQKPSKKTYPLTIEVAENPLLNEGGEPVATKATITTTSSLSAFYMSYMIGNTPSSVPITATKDEVDGKWKSSDQWPAGGDVTVNWYAYSCNESTRGIFHGNSGNSYIDFTVDEAAANQHDLLVATALNKTWSNCGGILSFTFDHVCSALRFYVKKATNLNDYTLSVSSIVLKNVVKHGNYFYGTGEWTPITANPKEDITEYTLYSGSAIELLSATTNYVALNGNFGSAEAPYLFVIPQTLAEWNTTGELSNTYLEISCTITKTSDSSPVYNGKAYIPFRATFEKGVQHDVKINIGKNSLYSGPNTKVIP